MKSSSPIARESVRADVVHFGTSLFFERLTELLLALRPTNAVAFRVTVVLALLSDAPSFSFVSSRQTRYAFVVTPVTYRHHRKLDCPDMHCGCQCNSFLSRSVLCATTWRDAQPPDDVSNQPYFLVRTQISPNPFILHVDTLPTSFVIDQVIMEEGKIGVADSVSESAGSMSESEAGDLILSIDDINKGYDLFAVPSEYGEAIAELEAQGFGRYPSDSEGVVFLSPPRGSAAGYSQSIHTMKVVSYASPTDRYPPCSTGESKDLPPVSKNCTPRCVWVHTSLSAFCRLKLCVG